MRRFLRLLAGAAAAMLAGAIGYAITERIDLFHGVYCSLGTATTFGCDVTPRGWARTVAAFLMLTALPLLGWIFSWATAEHTHQRGREHREQQEATSKAIHQITADLHRQVTGNDHPLAPSGDTTEEPP